MFVLGAGDEGQGGHPMKSEMNVLMTQINKLSPTTRHQPTIIAVLATHQGNQRLKEMGFSFCLAD